MRDVLLIDITHTAYSLLSYVAACKLHYFREFFTTQFRLQI